MRIAKRIEASLCQRSRNRLGFPGRRFGPAYRFEMVKLGMRRKHGAFVGGGNSQAIVDIAMREHEGFVEPACSPKTSARVMRQAPVTAP